MNGSSAFLNLRKPAERPWLAMGISRSTYYRRRAKAREQAALALAAAVLDRLAWQVAELRTHRQARGAQCGYGGGARDAVATIQFHVLSKYNHGCKSRTECGHPACNE